MVLELAPAERCLSSKRKHSLYVVSQAW